MELDITSMRNAGMLTIVKILAINLIFVAVVLFLLNCYFGPYMKLFSSIQETFDNIKHNLSTFIPQGCVASKDPLQEAKSIIGELSEIYKFKKNN